MNGARREIGGRGGQNQGPGLNVLGRHLVAQVHQIGGGIEAQDDALQAGHIGVPGAEIGEQGDEGTGCGGH
jgi:hypothetical protein